MVAEATTPLIGFRTFAMPADAPDYLQPYLNATKRYGAGFGSLLWASPQTQAARFDALLDAVDVNDLVVLDVGCGRADLLQHMLDRGVVPRQYIGLEAVDELAAAAEAKRLPHARIARGDFVHDPTLLSVDADVLLFSGSLNTLSEAAFYRTLAHAYAAARRAVVFNFLASPYLAASSFLTWHRPKAVLDFCATLTGELQMWDDYLKGDATVRLMKATR